MKFRVWGLSFVVGVFWFRAFGVQGHCCRVRVQLVYEWFSVYSLQSLALCQAGFRVVVML